jgi:Hydantoinase/oxoprolinase N-terminal region
MRVATDVGGTFTDLVYFDEEAGRSGAVKVDTTPPDFERGVIEGFRKSGLDRLEIELFSHGTTVVINALTERRGRWVSSRPAASPTCWDRLRQPSRPLQPLLLQAEAPHAQIPPEGGRERLEHKGAVDDYGNLYLYIEQGG